MSSGSAETRGRQKNPYLYGHRRVKGVPKLSHKFYKLKFTAIIRKRGGTAVYCLFLLKITI